MVLAGSIRLWLLVVAAVCVLAPPASAVSSPSVEILSIQQSTTGNAVVDIYLGDQSFWIKSFLPAGDLFSSTQVIIDFRIASDGVLSLDSTLGSRSLWDCHGIDCDPLHGLTSAILRLTPDPVVLLSHNPGPGGSGDVYTSAQGESSAIYRMIHDISQLGGNGDARFTSGMVTRPIPEPGSAVLFGIGALVISAALRRMALN